MSVRSVCEKGFHTYLAEQHRSSVDKSLSQGLVAGGVASGLYTIANHYLNFSDEWYYNFAPLVIITAASVAYQSVGVSASDLEHKEAFESICSKYEEKDEEDGE